MVGPTPYAVVQGAPLPHSAGTDGDSQNRSRTPPPFDYLTGQASSGFERFGEHVTTAKDRYEGRSR